MLFYAIVSPHFGYKALCSRYILLSCFNETEVDRLCDLLSEFVTIA